MPRAAPGHCRAASARHQQLNRAVWLRVTSFWDSELQGYRGMLSLLPASTTCPGEGSPDPCPRLPWVQPCSTHPVLPQHPGSFGCKVRKFGPGFPRLSPPLAADPRPKAGDGGCPALPHMLPGGKHCSGTPQGGHRPRDGSSNSPQELALSALQRERASSHFLSCFWKRSEQLLPTVKNSFLAKEYSQHNLIGGHFQAQILTENKDSSSEPH